MTEILESKIAWALYKALDRTGRMEWREPLISEPERGAPAVIDGVFDLYVAASELITALHASGLTITASPKAE